MPCDRAWAATRTPSMSARQLSLVSHGRDERDLERTDNPSLGIFDDDQLIVLVAFNRGESLVVAFRQRIQILFAGRTEWIIGEQLDNRRQVGPGGGAKGEHTYQRVTVVVAVCLNAVTHSLCP